MTATRARPLIVVVEDVELNRDLVEQLLEDDYDLVFASDGEAALTTIVARSPDLVLMDVSIPKIDGLDCTRRLRAMPATARIPIVALTAHAMSGDRERAFDAGCDDFVTKPIDEVRLAAVVAGLLTAR